MDSSKICRLCLQNNPEYIELFSKNGKEQGITKIISQHFWFEPLETDNFSNLICICCWECLNSFHKFYNGVKDAQENLLKSQDIQSLALENEPDNTHDSVNIKKEVKEESYSCLEDTEFFDDNEDNEDNDDNVDGVDAEEIKGENESNTNIKTEDPNPEIKAVKRSTRKKAATSSVVELPVIKRKRGRPPKDFWGLATNKAKPIKQKKVVKTAAEIEEEHERKSELRSKRDDEDQRIREFFKLECQLCPVKLNTFIEVKVHYRQVHAVHRGYIICCNKKLIRRCDILQHLSWHLNPNEFRCSICNKVYNDKYGLKLHMFHHAPEEDRSFKCDICGRGYATKGKLTHHLQISHVSEDGKIHKCQECGKSFALHSILQSHIRRVHESYYATVCDICAKVFKSKSQCAIHRNTQHSDEKPQKVQCSLCGAWLKNEISLNCHMRRSHQRVPQSCKICGKISPNKDALRNHMRYVHELKRLYKCHYCDKAFKQSVGLKEHMASHTGAVLYVCPYCPKTFNSNANMHSHRKNKHPTEWERDRNIRMGPTQT